MIGQMYAGLVYEMGDHWVAEVFGKDLASGFGSFEEAKGFVEANR